MKRNEIAHFSQAPSASIQRSVFDMSFGRHTSFDAGKLYPIFHMEVLPGDTIHVDSSMVTRMQTPLFPVMDNAYVDTYFFFVPNRLVWSKWKEFCGENNTSAWDDNIEYSIPTCVAPSGGFRSGSLADHLRIPIYTTGVEVDELPFRGIRLIWNRWFRNQNVQAPKLVNLGNGQSSGDIANDICYPVNRFRDYFSSSLPAPQKGASVSIPLDGSAPVLSGYDLTEDPAMNDLLFSSPTIHWFSSPAAPSTLSSLGVSYAGQVVGETGSVAGRVYNSRLLRDSDSTDIGVGYKPSNLHARFDLGQGYATVNALRQAFQIQRILEKDARSGTRYVELLRSHFSVIAPDASLQDPEYLGGQRFTVNMDQVLQTSSLPSEDTPLGSTGAFSKTTGSGQVFRKSFTEHGRILGFACVRTDRSYQQGIPREFLRRTRFDFYWPALAHIGEQQVKAIELYAGSGTNVVSKDIVFGYQEAWAEYRSRPNEITGAFRTNYVGGQGFNAWHYGDWYTSRPILSDSWMQEGSERVARTLAASDLAIDSQFLADFWFTVTAARPMPLYSVPGLIDHF